MTPDHALRQAILQTDHPAAKRKSTKPRKARRAKTSRPFRVSFLMRAVVMVLGLLAVRVMLYTPQGEVLMSRAQGGLAALLEQHMPAARHAPDIPDAAAQKDATAQRSAKRVSASGEVTVPALQTYTLPQSRVTIRRGGQTSVPMGAK